MFEKLDPDFLVALGVALLGLALSTTMLPLFSTEAATVLAFAG